MARGTILIVEDEADILELVRFNLERDGYETVSASSGEEALDLLRKRVPDAIVLDLMLPGVDGFEVCRSVKSDPATRAVPVIMLTARSEDADVVAGLELGADDYILKPFRPRVLLARVKTVLRRNPPAAASGDLVVLRSAHFRIDPGRHEVLVDGTRIDLTVTEFRLLYTLAARPGWVFTRAHIVEAVRGDGYPVTDRSVDVQIVGLRKKLGKRGSAIETVRGVGYRFSE